MSLAPALVVLNPAARHGTGLARYHRIQGLLEARYALSTVVFDRQGRWRNELRQALAAGTRVVIAAGGDGTVGAVASAIVEGHGPVPLEGLTLGAVGLGSSNDFHKPVTVASRRVPLRIDTERRALRDVARARYENGTGGWHERLFLVSASLGVTAAANAFFNEEKDRVLRLLKARWVDGAVVYAALVALCRHGNLAGRLELPEGEETVALSNLSVLKTPHLSGCLRYDTPVAPDSGRLAVNLCAGMSRPQLVSVLAGLVRGRFCGRRGTHHWTVDRLQVDLAAPAPLELDGEVVTARRVVFDVLPERIGVCH
jgi:diacylglycerol kinase family enzyme